jgi:hypothetical protein
MNELEKEKVNLETAQIVWTDLQRFFAKGEVVWVSSELDLIDVSYQFAIDDKASVQNWLEAQKIALVSDAQALRWFETNAELWAVVVKPWILVQEEISA